MTLDRFFIKNPRLAVAFSGGVDSGLLLACAAEAGCDVRPYFAMGGFQPEFELRDAEKTAAQLGLSLTVLRPDALSCESVAENGDLRCYHCKRLMLGEIVAAAESDGYLSVADGSNADDAEAGRPGMRAARELGVVSPLKLCGITKTRVRAMARERGLFIWDKPAYACLATRIPAGTRITAELLRRVEAGENSLRGMGFRDFRLRLFGGAARLQLTPEQLPEAARRREEILTALSGMFDAVLLDLEGRNSL